VTFERRFRAEHRWAGIFGTTRPTGCPWSARFRDTSAFGSRPA